MKSTSLWNALNIKPNGVICISPHSLSLLLLSIAHETCLTICLPVAYTIEMYEIEPPYGTRWYIDMVLQWRKKKFSRAVKQQCATELNGEAATNDESKIYVRNKSRSKNL